MNNLRHLILRTVLFVLLMACGSVLAQSNSESIKTDFSMYLEAIKSKDFESSLEYLVDDVFDIVPKETMLMVMEQTFNAEGIEFSLGAFDIQDVNEPIVVDSTSYVILNYSSDMSIRFTPDEEEEEASEEEKKTTRIITQAALEQLFGKDNVSYNESTDFYDIKAIKQAVAIRKEANEKWKFIVVEKSSGYLLKSILPTSILEKVLTED